MKQSSFTILFSFGRDTYFALYLYVHIFLRFIINNTHNTIMYNT